MDRPITESKNEVKNKKLSIRVDTVQNSSPMYSPNKTKLSSNTLSINDNSKTNISRSSHKSYSPCKRKKSPNLSTSNLSSKVTSPRKKRVKFSKDLVEIINIQCHKKYYVDYNSGDQNEENCRCLVF